MRQVSTVLTDLSRGITDVIFKGGKIGDMFKSVASQAAQSITRLLIEGALKDLGRTLLGIGKTSSSVFGGIAQSIGSVFGSGSKGASPIFSAAGSVGDLGAAAQVPGGGIAGAAGAEAGAGISGAIGLVAGIGSLISGVVGNFQMAGMNKTLDLIEKEVRYSQIHLSYILEKQNEYLPKLKDIWDSLIRMETRQMEFAGGGGMVVNITGNTFGNDMTQATVDAMFRTAIDKFKRQGLN
jgi:hypothetical protein